MHYSPVCKLKKQVGIIIATMQLAIKVLVILFLKYNLVDLLFRNSKIVDLIGFDTAKVGYHPPQKVQSISENNITL